MTSTAATAMTSKTTTKPPSTTESPVTSSDVNRILIPTRPPLPPPTTTASTITTSIPSKTKSPIVSKSAMVFVADRSDGEIYMAEFTGDRLDSLIFNRLPLKSVLYPQAVDYDPDTNTVFWTDYSSIRRGNIDGTDQRVIADIGVRYPDGIALDRRRRKVFWTDVSRDHIVSANFDGSSRRILINTDIHRPRSIIVHEKEGVMFWTDCKRPAKIERANVDGRSRNTIVKTKLRFPNGLAFNDDGSRIYWCDGGTDRIESVDLWGNARMVHLAASLIYPFDLAVINGSIIWTDWNNDALGVTASENGSGYTLYYRNFFKHPYGIHFYKGPLSLSR